MWRALLPLLIAGCSPTPPAPLPPHTLAIRPDLLSGPTPHDRAAFQGLQRYGVRTIISVDGAIPDAITAEQLGMRYVHLPIGYDGISPQRQRELARAIRDLPKPIYLHCHHGKHRGPAAAMTACRLLPQPPTREEAEALLHRAGTDERYRGLWQAVRDAEPLAETELDAIPLDFPAQAKTNPVVDAMVQIDEVWDRLRAAEKANWPDDSAVRADALLLAEAFAELQREPERVVPAGTFRDWLRQSEEASRSLDGTNMDRIAAMERLRQGCLQCHREYRDGPMR